MSQTQGVFRLHTPVDSAVKQPPIAEQTLVIPAEKNAAVFFLPLWLCFWYMGEADGLRDVLYKQATWFDYNWLIWWSFFGILFHWSLLYMLVGAETFSLDEHYLSHQHSIFRFGLGWAKKYKLLDLHNVKVIESDLGGIKPEPTTELFFQSHSYIYRFKLARPDAEKLRDWILENQERCRVRNEE